MLRRLAATVFTRLIGELLQRHPPAIVQSHRNHACGSGTRDTLF
jgi:hypothetical protein